MRSNLQNNRPITDAMYRSDPSRYKKRENIVGDVYYEEIPYAQRHKPSLEILLNAPRPQVKSILKFCNTHLLRKKRLGTLIAPIGVGKTSATEAIFASHLNNHCDTFELEV